MAERVLIAGCGDLGMRIAARLLAQAYEVFGLRRHPPDAGADGMAWVAADLRDERTLRTLPQRIERLVFAPTPDARDEQAYRAVFVAGLSNLLDALDLSPSARALLVSSTAVYGAHGDAWVDEDTPADPPGFNGRVLLQSERMLIARLGPRGVVLRLAGLYGSGREGLIQRLRAGAAKAPRDQPHWANRIHVDDAAAAAVHLLHVGAVQPLYLGVDDTPLPLHLLYDDLAARLGVPPPADGPPPQSVGSKRLCNARLRASGWAPQWPDARKGYAALLASVEAASPDGCG